MVGVQSVERVWSRRGLLAAWACRDRCCCSVVGVGEETWRGGGLLLRGVGHDVTARDCRGNDSEQSGEEVAGSVV